MKTKSRKVPKKLLVIITVVFLALIATGGAFAYSIFSAPSGQNPQETEESKTQENTQSGNDNTYEPPTGEQSDAGEDIKEEVIKDDADETTDKITVSVSAVHNSGTLRIQTTISKISNSGSCTLTLEKAGTKKTYSSDVQALSSYSTCKGFSIDTAGFSPGTWDLSITYRNESSQATTSTKVIIE